MAQSTEAPALVEAARNGDVRALRAALAEGADVRARDADDWSALDWAAGRGDAEAVRILLAAGAPPGATGREARTPYEIALAAGHLDAARELRAAEDAARGDGPAPRRTWEPYCRAYPAADLAASPDWPAGDDRTGGDGGTGEDALLYLHHDLTVTRSIWHGEDVVFDAVTPRWERFCREDLGFTVPDDFDLVP
ncbi:ankyrin repeat domain-containing protein [Streptomyces mobaraensis NBRC 13819 = DSM 40847]|uniref:Ankyrin repeat domain-containing protein n=3 Tax=Streptomyces TaxID=1883 RepID=A0A5N5VZ09_STRMB|nr:ankyrin repeat domain-containing protein [Streptomyces mobaraensis]AAB00459.1 ankyrin homologue [Streptomyces verticillus]EME99226.1 Ankyrin [Streptomyces mobaraensis NBRC 13819 = DSM 40847]KAB7833930.1 ankyrin repeat domain-containing protein [Streptomyces mobaraensis]QTT72081.1 ankyrin repeat domain-containing protein [Streptomyces mobaraensis NBRC 13819 = DSM 40847]prf//2104260C ank gene [Streptomyces verticillus]